MEFDILNEILTGTVASLFTDFSKHQQYMKTSSQMGQDKSEIPKASSSTDLGQFVIDQPKHDGTMDLGVAQWLSNEAKQKLQEAFIKLNLDVQKTNGKHL